MYKIFAIGTSSDLVLVRMRVPLFNDSGSMRRGGTAQQRADICWQPVRRPLRAAPQTYAPDARAHAHTYVHTCEAPGTYAHTLVCSQVHNAAHGHRL